MTEIVKLKDLQGEKEKSGGRGNDGGRSPGGKPQRPDEPKDRVAKYLRKLNEGTLFDELNDEMLDRLGMTEVLKGVPVPVDAGEGQELTTRTIAVNMGRVLGGDPDFPFRAQYLEYIKRIFGDQAVKAMIGEGVKRSSAGNYEAGAMFFRTALLMEPQNRDALYYYGRALTDAYSLENEDEDYVGSFKAEAIDIFELLTMIHQDFDMGYYFLGYSYANLGLYKKAQLTWQTFLELSSSRTDKDGDDMREEISERLEALEEPVKIEAAVNDILRGDFQSGRDVLLGYTEGSYSQWWPLWYYLAQAETALGSAEEAIQDYKTALRYSPSNIQVMEELIQVYEAVGLNDSAEKYRKKIEIVKENMAAEE